MRTPLADSAEGQDDLKVPQILWMGYEAVCIRLFKVMVRNTNSRPWSVVMTRRSKNWPNMRKRRGEPSPIIPRGRFGRTRQFLSPGVPNFPMMCCRRARPP